MFCKFQHQGMSEQPIAYVCLDKSCKCDRLICKMCFEERKLQKHESHIFSIISLEFVTILIKYSTNKLKLLKNFLSKYQNALFIVINSINELDTLQKKIIQDPDIEFKESIIALIKYYSGEIKNYLQLNIISINLNKEDQKCILNKIDEIYGYEENEYLYYKYMNYGNSLFLLNLHTQAEIVYRKTISLGYGKKQQLAETYQQLIYTLLYQGKSQETKEINVRLYKDGFETICPELSQLDCIKQKYISIGFNIRNIKGSNSIYCKKNVIHIIFALNYMKMIPKYSISDISKYFKLQTERGIDEALNEYIYFEKYEYLPVVLKCSYFINSEKYQELLYFCQNIINSKLPIEYRTKDMLNCYTLCISNKQEEIKKIVKECRLIKEEFTPLISCLALAKLGLYDQAVKFVQKFYQLQERAEQQQNNQHYQSNIPLLDVYNYCEALFCYALKQTQKIQQICNDLDYKYNKSQAILIKINALRLKNQYGEALQLIDQYISTTARRENTVTQIQKDLSILKLMTLYEMGEIREAFIYLQTVRDILQFTYTQNRIIQNTLDKRIYLIQALIIYKSDEDPIYHQLSKNFMDKFKTELLRNELFHFLSGIFLYKEKYFQEALLHFKECVKQSQEHSVYIKTAKDFIFSLELTKLKTKELLGRLDVNDQTAIYNFVIHLIKWKDFIQAKIYLDKIQNLIEIVYLQIYLLLIQLEYQQAFQLIGQNKKNKKKNYFEFCRIIALIGLKQYQNALEIIDNWKKSNLKYLSHMSFLRALTLYHLIISNQTEKQYSDAMVWVEESKKQNFQSLAQVLLKYLILLKQQKENEIINLSDELFNFYEYFPSDYTLIRSNLQSFHFANLFFQEALESLFKKFNILEELIMEEKLIQLILQLTLHEMKLNQKPIIVNQINTKVDLLILELHMFSYLRHIKNMLTLGF